MMLAPSWPPVEFVASLSTFSRRCSPGPVVSLLFRPGILHVRAPAAAVRGAHGRSEAVGRGTGAAQPAACAACSGGAAVGGRSSGFGSRTFRMLQL